MAVIDADAHVVETEKTWEYVSASDKAYKPVILKNEETGQRVIVIDGKIRQLGAGASGIRPVVTAQRALELGIPTERNVATTEGAFELENMEARIADMDKFGVDMQVLQPTMFLSPYSDVAATQVALCGAYNQWIADLTKNYRDRVRWVCPLPLLSMSDALDQLRFAHDNGAVGVFMRPFEGDRPTYDRYFDPLYEEVVRLNMAAIVHVGNGNTEMTELLRKDVAFGRGFLPFVFPVAGVLHGTITNGLPLRFPTLRIGFLEAAAEWIPWLLKDLRRRAESKDLPEDLLHEYRLYVACYTTDDIPRLVENPDIGTRALVIGTDYGHTDVSAEVEAVLTLKKKGDLSSEVVRNILEANPANLYGIPE